MLEVDLRKFFDMVDHREMLELLGRRVGDGMIACLIAKWLKAGVWEKGEVSYTDKGTHKGGVISPLLGNIYLRAMLNKRFVETVQPRCKGKTFMVRFVDDFIMGFENLKGVEKVRKVIGKRFERFGLKVNTEKAKLVCFGRPKQAKPERHEKPETFDFLGFTHNWGKSRRGYWVVTKKTAASRFRRALRNIREWGMKNRHLPLKEQQRALNRKLRGHDAYCGIAGNYRMLSQVRCQVAKLWRKWLGRRNRRGVPNWEKFQALLRIFPLGPARIVHSRS